MELSPIRVRFAPAPSGFMHLGNIRTALMNYLFARQSNGTMVIRLEDTDASRIIDPSGKQILNDLAWLGITYDEGIEKGGPFAPYSQSKRSIIYQEYLEKLRDKGVVYRCFCSEELLEKERQQQIALRMPPRYNQRCLALTPEELETHLRDRTPFIWRVRLDRNATIIISDLARKSVRFELQNYSDFPLTRKDGSFTFLFANVVDDIAMKITHVFRGEDHLSNTGMQGALYEYLSAPMPTFWHMPVLCSTDGKKLSKRDFGFSIRDLQEGGYLPEAVCNYVAILGSSMHDTLLSIEKLASTIDFSAQKAMGTIAYDSKQLAWYNKKWIQDLSTHELHQRLKDFIHSYVPECSTPDSEALLQIATKFQNELTTLRDALPLLATRANAPTLTRETLSTAADKDSANALTRLITACQENIATTDLNEIIRTTCKKENVPLKSAFQTLRYGLTGELHGASIADLVALIGADESLRRLQILTTMLIE